MLRKYGRLDQNPSGRDASVYFLLEAMLPFFTPFCSSADMVVWCRKRLKWRDLGPEEVEVELWSILLLKSFVLGFV